MAKWADYAIYAVRFNAGHTHIDRVRAYPDNGDSFGATVEQTRLHVIAAIKRDTTYVTTFQRDGKWQRGQPVFVIKVNGVEFIKTVDNGKAADNLDDLPEF